MFIKETEGPSKKFRQVGAKKYNGKKFDVLKVDMFSAPQMKMKYESQAVNSITTERTQQNDFFSSCCLMSHGKLL